MAPIFGHLFIIFNANYVMEFFSSSRFLLNNNYFLVFIKDYKDFNRDFKAMYILCLF